MQSRYCVSITDKYRVEEPRYLWYCGTKKYRKGDGAGTVEKWYRGAAVVPWYRATLMGRMLTGPTRPSQMVFQNYRARPGHRAVRPGHRAVRPMQGSKLDISVFQIKGIEFHSLTQHADTRQ